MPSLIVPSPGNPYHVAERSCQYCRDSVSARRELEPFWVKMGTIGCQSWIFERDNTSRIKESSPRKIDNRWRRGGRPWVSRWVLWCPISLWWWLYPLSCSLIDVSTCWNWIYNTQCTGIFLLTQDSHQGSRKWIMSRTQMMSHQGTQMHLIERKYKLFERTHMNANANANGSSQGNASMQGVNAKFYVPSWMSV